MPEESAQPPGLMHALRRLVETFVAIVECRVELASVEMQEEKIRAIAVLLLAALAALGILMFALTITALVVILCWGHALIALGVFAAFYALAALFAWRELRHQLEKPFFAETINQLKKDRQWLLPRN